MGGPRANFPWRGAAIVKETEYNISMNTPTVIRTINLAELVKLTKHTNGDVKKAGINCRFVQENTLAKGPITRCNSQYSVWTMEYWKGSTDERWWCCHGGHQIEILDHPQPTHIGNKT